MRNDLEVEPAVVKGVAVDMMDLHIGWGVRDLAVHPDVMAVTVSDNTPRSIVARVGLEQPPIETTKPMKVISVNDAIGVFTQLD